VVTRVIHNLDEGDPELVYFNGLNDDWHRSRPGVLYRPNRALGFQLDDFAFTVTSRASAKYLVSCLVRVTSWIVPFVQKNKNVVTNSLRG